jgi:hypothetical protein
MGNGVLYPDSGFIQGITHHIKSEVEKRIRGEIDRITTEVILETMTRMSVTFENDIMRNKVVLQFNYKDGKQETSGS